MMKLKKTFLKFLTTVFLGLLLFPVGYVFSQNHESEDKLTFGNVLLMNDNHFKDGNISQKGFLNHMFILSSLDSPQYTVSKFEGSQNGILNHVIIYSQRNAAQFNANIDQQGVRNRLTILKAEDKQFISKKDGTVSKKNSVTIRQKGNGHSATVIQN